MSTTTILLYGRTGSGKTTQIGVLAEEVFITTGKKTRLYTADLGGTDTIAPHINLGFIEVVALGASDPWIFTNRAVRGYVKDTAGRWVLDVKRNAEVGFYAFESAHGLAKLMKLDMERKAALGISIGGDVNSSFETQGDGEKLKIGSTKGFQKFAIPQTRIQEEMMESQKLQAEYVLWSAGADKDDDDVSTVKIVGPSVIGKALTTTLPQDFSYCFRIDVLPAQGGKPARHLLYLGTHTDAGAGNATALGNIRRPIDAPELKELIIEPANLAKALRTVRHDSVKAATDVIKGRIDAARKAQPQLVTTK